MDVFFLENILNKPDSLREIQFEITNNNQQKTYRLSMFNSRDLHQNVGSNLCVFE